MLFSIKVSKLPHSVSFMFYGMSHNFGMRFVIGFEMLVENPSGFYSSYREQELHLEMGWKTNSSQGLWSQPDSNSTSLKFSGTLKTHCSLTVCVCVYVFGVCVFLLFCYFHKFTHFYI